MPTNLTSSGVTFPDATTQTGASGVPVTANTIIYNSPGTYSKPASLKYVYVSLTGGGGGGGSGGKSPFAPGASNGNSGGAGGTTSFGSLASATGGNGGSGGLAAGTTGSAGNIGTTTLSPTGSPITALSLIHSSSPSFSYLTSGVPGGGGGAGNSVPYGEGSSASGGQGGSGGVAGGLTAIFPNTSLPSSIPITVGSAGTGGTGLPAPYGSSGGSSGTAGTLIVTEVYPA